MTTPLERSRRFIALVLQKMQGQGATLAVAMGLSESTISRFRSEDLDRFCAILAHLGLKIVPAEYRCLPPEELNALYVLAKGRLSRSATVVDLFPEEDPE